MSLITFGRVKNPCGDCWGDTCTMNCSGREIIDPEEAPQLRTSQVEHLDHLNGAIDGLDSATNELIEALRPFAMYARQMAKAWERIGENSAFYGVKRPGAHQITYGDFRRADALLAKLERKP